MSELPTISPGWFRSWRVRWRREAWTEPKIVTFGLFSDAERYCRQCSVYEPSKVDGPVVEIELQERLTTAWTTVHRVDVARQQRPPKWPGSTER
jgi:hypothetical protein